MRLHYLLCLIFALGPSSPVLSAGVSESVTLREPESPFVAFNVWIQAGSQHDPKGKEGLASLTASLLAEGSTRSRSYQAILDELYPMAAGYSASVDKEMTVFTGVVHRDNLEAYYALFKDAILEPAFKAEDFSRLKAQAVTYVSQLRRFSSDEELGKELLFREIFRGTPYEHPEEGYVESVKAITLEDAKEFYRAHFRRGSVVVGIAGGYPDAFDRKIKEDFGRLREGRAPEVARPQPKPIEGIHVLIVEKETKATAISLAYPISVLRSNEDFVPLFIANSWLGEHRSSSSRLYQVIRETRGMNYGDYSYIEAFPMGHYRSMPPTNVSRRQQIFQIWIRPISMQQEGDMHNRALFALRAALRELDHLIENGMEAEEFAIRKGFLQNYTVNYGATLSSRLGYAIDDGFYGIEPPGYLASLRPAIQKTTLSEVNEAVKKHLHPDDLWIVFITQDAGGLEELLVSGKETPIEYPTQKPAEVLAEDRLIQKFPIPVPEENIRIVGIDQVLEK